MKYTGDPEGVTGGGPGPPRLLDRLRERLRVLERLEMGDVLPGDAFFATYFLLCDPHPLAAGTCLGRSAVPGDGGEDLESPGTVRPRGRPRKTPDEEAWTHIQPSPAI